MKFKVWDSKRKEFTSGPETFYFGEDGTLWDGWGGEELSKADPNYMPVCSTGQTDKNGVEIYEGDVINIGGVKNYKVEFVRGAWKIGQDHMHFWKDELEIIGNKFENPELLEPKK